MSFRFYNVLFLSLLIIITSCKNNDDPEPIPTSLEITFLDGTGNIISNANVKLFETENELLNRSNQIGSQQVSNSQGKVSFSNLKSIKYYWLAEKGCLNNINGSITTRDALTVNRVNTVNSILSETGSITLINNSSNPYEFYLNGAKLDIVNGQTSYELNGLTSGTYSVRVVQLSGFVLFPTDLSYSPNISCNNNATISFP